MDLCKLCNSENKDNIHYPFYSNNNPRDIRIYRSNENEVFLHYTKGINQFHSRSKISKLYGIINSLGCLVHRNIRFNKDTYLKLKIFINEFFLNYKIK
jgi:hypothetical protein